MYKFQSRVSADLLMLEVNGQQILRIIGKESTGPKVQGILLAAQMPQAIAALQAAVAQEEAARKELKAQTPQTLGHAQEEAPGSQAVSLRQRAAPFIALLERCYSADADLVWGV